MEKKPMTQIIAEMPTESFDKKLDTLMGKHPTPAALASLSRAIGKHLFYQSCSHINLIDDLKGVCEVITKTIADNEENICSSNAKIKLAVLVEGADGIYDAV